MQSVVLNSHSCPLCCKDNLADYHCDKHRYYLQCKRCSLVSVPRQFHLSSEAEKEVYDQHQNSPDDAGYREFLAKLVTPLLARLPNKSCGLDFGSGPGPTLSVMLEDQGHSMNIYDLYYARDEAVLEKSYDFITSTEVVEHLACPKAELEHLWSLIDSEGYLGLMTKLVIDQKSFSSWHYKNDPTHISFFSKATFNYLARQWGAKVEFIGNDVIIFQK